MYNYIVDPYTNRKINIYSKEGKNLILNYIKYVNLVGGSTQKKTLKILEEDYFEWEKKIIKQINTVYSDNKKISRNLDKQILEFLIKYAISKGKTIVYTKGKQFVRTCNRTNVT